MADDGKHTLSESSDAAAAAAVLAARGGASGGEGGWKGVVVELTVGAVVIAATVTPVMPWVWKKAVRVAASLKMPCERRVAVVVAPAEGTVMTAVICTDADVTVILTALADTCAPVAIADAICNFLPES
jgi:hypothetical protein